MKRYYAEGVMSRRAAEQFLQRNRHEWKKLRDKRVLVAGAGGLGSFVIAGLIGSGVGEVHVVDFDVVEPSNLNRQFWYKEEDVGKPKAEVIKKRAERGFVKMVAIKKRIEEVDVKEYDAVVDCLDEWEVKLNLMKRAIQEGVPIVVISAGEGKGFVSVPEEPIEIKIRKARKVSTPELMIAAGFAVEQVIEILLGKKPSLLGKLLAFDVESLVLEVMEL